jgi:hypothetical protein
MKSHAALLGVFPLLFAEGVLAASSDIGKSYRVYHKLGNESRMTSRGTIKIAPTTDAEIGLVATFHPDDTAQLDVASFDAMVDSGALYTIVVLDGGGEMASSVSPYPPSKDTRHVSASVPGCSIRRSNLREEIGLSIGPTGNLLGVSYRPIISPLAPKTCHRIRPLLDRPEAIFGRKSEDEGGGDVGGGPSSSSSMPFKTTVYFDSHKPMMAIPTVLPEKTRPPPGLKWYRRNSKNNPSPLLGGARREDGGIPGVDDEPPPGSFKSTWMYRYWYILLPMAIVMLFGGVDDEEAKKQQQAAQSGGAGGVPAVTAGTVASSGSGAKQRRGKRD